MGEFSVTSRIIEPIKTLVVELHGENRYSVSKVNAGKLVDRIVRDGHDGLIIDYRDCVLGHQMAEYNEIARIFAGGMPQGLSFAYVYKDAQVAHIILMTRALKAAGIRVQAFPEIELAVGWITAGRQDLGKTRIPPAA